jgi:hypothetical protein
MNKTSKGIFSNAAISAGVKDWISSFGESTKN